MIEETAVKYLSVLEDAALKAGVEYELVHVTNDFPAEAIVDMAQKKACDVIFIASHGRRASRGPMLGSETQKVTSQAAIPVVIYRNEAATTPT